MKGGEKQELPPLLRGVPAEGAEATMKRAVSRRLDRKQVLFHEGDKAVALYLVESGRLKLTQLAADGQEVLVRFVGPGEMCAAITALDGSAYPVTAQAVEPTKLIVWPREVLRELCDLYPQIQANILGAIAGHMHDAMTRTRELATERVPQRVARALLRLAQQSGRPVEGGVLIDHSLSRQELAEMTGTTLYTVSRLLSQWESEGLVEAGRERVLLRSPEGLSELAEDLGEEDSR